MRVQRTDVGELRGHERTPQGGLRVAAAFTRTGVLTYRDANGKQWTEYRPDDTVFSSDSLKTLRGATVTDKHPPSLVDASTWKQVAVGHVGDDVRREGNLLVGTLVVNDAAEIARIEAGERKDISLGYSCEVDPTPGVTPEGERYDAVQRSLVNNHAALLPPGEGRAGPEVALRMDGAAIQVPASMPAQKTNEVRVDTREEKKMTLTLKVRDTEYKLDAAEDMSKAQGAVDAVVKKADMDAGELSAVKAALMDALQKVAMLEAKMAASSAVAAPAPMDEAAMTAALDARDALRSDARKVLGESFDFKGKTPAEIKKAAVTKSLPNVKLDSLSAETIDGMFTACVHGSTPTPRNDALGAANAAAIGNPAEAPREDAEDPYTKMCRRLESEHTKPLSVQIGKD